MAKNARFQRFKEWVRERVQGLGDRLTRLWTKGIAWGHRGAEVGRTWMHNLQRQWPKIWQGAKTSRQKAGNQLRRHIFLLVSIIMLILFILSLWKFPEWQVTGAKFQHDKERLELIDKIRGTLAQIWGGLGLALGLYFTWRRIAAAERTVQVAEEGQITERFTRAIDQLGATNEQGGKRLELRLGGIYALERIARDSEKDHWPIMEILTAYVREHAPWQKDSQSQQDQPSEKDGSQQQDPQSQPKLDTDIQAILTVLGRRTRWYGQGEDQYLNLDRTDIHGADLQRAHLEGAYLNGAHLEGAHLQKAHLQEAHLEGAHLQGAYLFVAHLERAYLRGAHLQGAYLFGAHLEGAHLEGAHLEGAHLEGAHLEGAHLQRAHLEGAYLSDAHLEEADLEGADLRNVKGLTSKQLIFAYTIEGALLPDYLTSSQAVDEEDV